MTAKNLKMTKNYCINSCNQDDDLRIIQIIDGAGWKGVWLDQGRIFTDRVVCFGLFSDDTVMPCFRNGLDFFFENYRTSNYLGLIEPKKHVPFRWRWKALKQMIFGEKE